MKAMQNNDQIDETPAQKAIRLAGGVVAVQKGMQMKSNGEVSKWNKGGSVPPKRVPGLVRLCKGRVPAHKIRPDLPDLFPPPES